MTSESQNPTSEPQIGANDLKQELESCENDCLKLKKELIKIHKSNDHAQGFLTVLTIKFEATKQVYEEYQKEYENQRTNYEEYCKHTAKKREEYCEEVNKFIEKNGILAKANKFNESLFDY